MAIRNESKSAVSQILALMYQSAPTNLLTIIATILNWWCDRQFRCFFFASAHFTYAHHWSECECGDVIKRISFIYDIHSHFLIIHVMNFVRMKMNIVRGRNAFRESINCLNDGIVILFLHWIWNFNQNVHNSCFYHNLKKKKKVIFISSSSSSLCVCGLP